MAQANSIIQLICSCCYLVVLAGAHPVHSEHLTSQAKLLQRVPGWLNINFFDQQQPFTPLGRLVHGLLILRDQGPHSQQTVSLYLH